MLFNSLEFLIFFPIVTTLYFVFDVNSRVLLLLLASCIFYMAFVPQYIMILFFLIVVDYFAGIMIEQAVPGKKKFYLIISLLSNCAILFFFKYYNFINDNISRALSSIGVGNHLPVLDIILPIGLSFHVFQAMSYTIEVYRNKQPAEKNFWIYSLYVMFYPQLVAGPIERPQNLIHQFKEKHSFDYKRVTDGLKLIAWGIFKKTVIADRAALLVTQVYSNPGDYQGIHFIIATIVFAFQIFCDFSAYSDIAIGSASVMGITLMKNFDRPYYSKTVSEFWKRWHISLSSWLRDYLYTALGGDSVVKWKIYCSLFITFLISGLWHGANWTYILWGGLNGFYIVFAHLSREYRLKTLKFTKLYRYPFIYKCYQAGITFILICFSWIFFRAASISDAFYIIKNLPTGLGEFVLRIHDISFVKSKLKGIGLEQYDFFILVIAILFMETIHMIQRNKSIRNILSDFPLPVRWAVYYASIFLVLKFGVFEKQEFIYFQF